MSEPVFIDDLLAGALRVLRGDGAAQWAFDTHMPWENVWARIEYHGIAYTFSSNADRLGDWPTALLDRISEEARLIALWEATHSKAIASVIAALGKEGIASVLMKGTALAYSLHDEPETRRRGDTDLLVHPKDQAQTRSILQELGWYRKEDPHGLYYQEGWLYDTAGFFVHSIDLHWEPSDRPVLQSILPLEAFFADAVPLDRLHPAARRPDAALMIIHATINQKWHALHGYHSESGRLASPRRLIWSIDLDLLCQSMTEQDWQKLTSHCASHGIGALVAEALEGMRSDLGTKLPEERVAKLREQPLDESLTAYFANTDSLSQFWIDLKKADSLSKKRKLLMTRAFPPRDHLLEKYPSAAKWPTLLLQGRLLLETAGRAARKVSAR